MSGIGNFTWSFFLEALALCFTTMAGTFSLHLEVSLVNMVSSFFLEDYFLKIPVNVGKAF